jgi:hypothetical protein
VIVTIAIAIGVAIGIARPIHFFATIAAAITAISDSACTTAPC